MTQQKLSTYAKVGLQGGAGTGKSTTAALLLLGLAIEYHDKAPVLVFDTEPGWQFLKPIFVAEGVNLIIENGRHFKGLTDAIHKAKAEGCCGFAGDSITHPWGELLERFADSTGRVPFHKFNQIKPLWNEWTVEFLNSPFHAIANGRLAWEYAYEEAEDGKKELVKGDAKMKAGGGESFGYEPHLLIEMSHERVREGGKLRGLQYTALVLKDRSRALNGQEFTFPDVGPYKKGGYKQVLDAFRPHIETLREISGVTMSRSNSASLVPGGDSEWHRKQREITIALEEVKAAMNSIYPASSGKDQVCKAEMSQHIFKTKSWEKVTTLSLVKLQEGLTIIQKYDQLVRIAGVIPEDRGKVEEMVRQAKTEVEAEGLEITKADVAAAQANLEKRRAEQPKEEQLAKAFGE